MNKNQLLKLIRIFLIVLILTLLALAAANIYHFWLKAERVRPEIVESFQPVLKVDLIKKAAEALTNKSVKL